MDLVSIIGWTAFALVALFGFLFAATFAIEREKRPAVIAFVVTMSALAILGTLLLIDIPFREWIIPGLIGVVVIAGGVIALPRTRLEGLRIVGKRSRVDERDAVLHRFYRIEEGTPQFEEYYENHPEKREFDDKLRAMPGLAKPGSKTYDPVTSGFQAACFGLTEDLTRDLDWSPAPIDGRKVEIDPADAAMRLKGFARYLGAVSVGCTRLDPAHVYSNIGRSPGKWGDPIDLPHTHAIAVTVPMAHEMVRLAPDSPTTTETAFEYQEVARIAMVLARYLNKLGYEARAHVDGNYRVMCVPVAVDAGLGELGRIGLLVTPEMGPRVRLAVVTTDLPLEQDEPITFGVQDFCRICMKCADICPSASIDAGEKLDHHGVEKWQSRQDTCYRYWRMAGSDCALCVKVCPYSHPTGSAHDMVRWLIRRNPMARRLALWSDDLLYGRRPAARYPYPDWHEKG